MKVYRVVEKDRDIFSRSTLNLTNSPIDGELYVTDCELAAIGWAIALKLQFPIIYEIEVTKVFLCGKEKIESLDFPQSASMGIDGIPLRQALINPQDIIGVRFLS